MKIIPIGKYAFSTYVTYLKSKTREIQQQEYERDDEKVAQVKAEMRDEYCFRTFGSPEQTTECVRIHTDEEYDAYFAQYVREHVDEFYKLENGELVVKYTTVSETVSVESDLPTAIEVEDVDTLAEELSRYAKKFVRGKLVAGDAPDAPAATERWYEKYYAWVQMLARGGASKIIDSIRDKTYATLDELMAEAKIAEAEA